MGIENETTSIVPLKTNVDSVEDNGTVSLLKQNTHFLDEYVDIDGIKSNGDVAIITQSITDYLNEKPTKLANTPEKMEIDILDRDNNPFFLYSVDASKKGIEKQSQKFRESCKNLCEIFHEIYKLKANKKHDNQEELFNLKRNGLIAFASFKSFFQIARLYVQEHHEHTAALQEYGKSKYVLLNSVLYEMTEVVHEIKICDRYTRYDNRLKMISFDEFKALQGQIANTIINNSSHAIILSRMNDELERRKSQHETLARLLKEKEAKTNEIRRINEFSRGLAPKLANIIEVAKPLQNYLNRPTDYERSQFKISKLLPENLYYLFVQAKAHRDAYDPNLEVKIVGDLAKGEAYEWKSTPKVVKNNRSVVVMAPGIKELTDTEINVLEQHPLSLKLTLTSPEDVSISLTFFMCTHLNIVTVKSDIMSSKNVDLTTDNFKDILNGESLLETIYLLDKGIICPNKAADLLIIKHNKGSFAEQIDNLGHAYLWTQYICGLNPTLRLVSVKEEHKYLRTTLDLITKRLSSRMGLINELVSIEKKEIQTLISPTPTQLKSIHSNILSWKRLSLEEIEVINMKTINNDNSTIKCCDEFVFTCTISNVIKGVNQYIYLYFFLSGDYPTTCPYCMISIEDVLTKKYVESNYTMNLQNHLNNKFLLSKISLSEQLYYAMHSWHIFNAMNSDQNEQNFKRTYRGPARNIPDAYNEKLKYFYHGKNDIKDNEDE